MAGDNIRIGPLSMSLGIVTPATALPSLNAVDLDVTAVTPTTNELSDVLVPLDAASTYQVYAAAFGFDVATSGYTFDIATVASPVAPQAITSGQGLACQMAVGDFPANLQYACGIALFLKEGSADPVLAQIEILDPAKNFDAIIVATPHPAALSFTNAVLVAATTNDDTGSRDPKACTFSVLGPTIDGIGLTYNVEGPNINLDSGTAYTAPTVRQPTVDFQVAENSMKNFIRATSGIYTRYTATGGAVIDIGRQSLAAAIARFTGNTVLKAIMPADSEGLSEWKFFFAMLKGTTSSISTRWGKSSVPTVGFNMPSAVQDKLLRNMHTEITKRYKSA